MKKKALIVSLRGTKLTKMEKILLSKEKPWGVILFKRNLKSTKQIKSLTLNIRNLTKDKKFPIIIDEEGERVSRLRNILCPTLIIHCPLDIVNGPRLTIPIEQAIPNAKGVTIEGAAHVIAGRTMREKYAEVLKEFLQEVNN